MCITALREVGSLVGEAVPARDGMRCVRERAWGSAALGGTCTLEEWRCMGRDALREGACVKERGAAAAAARRCTRHALESCGFVVGVVVE